MRLALPMIAALVFVTALGCEESRPRSSGGITRPRDAGTTSAHDAATTPGEDATSTPADDASASELDATSFDAGSRDAGTGPGDSGTPRDAGTVVDAGPAPFPTCLHTCTSPSDCTIGSSTLYDADNYSCATGTCEFLGCHNDQECVSGAAPGYVCRTIAPFIYANCYKSCTTPSDCTTPGTTLFDADNYSCTNFVCIWNGCNTAAECTAAFNDPNYACTAQAGLPFDNCVKTCGSPADCATPQSPLYDGDNYACTNNLCVYTGCNSTSECTTALSNPAYVCR